MASATARGSSTEASESPRKLLKRLVDRPAAEVVGVPKNPFRFQKDGLGDKDMVFAEEGGGPARLLGVVLRKEANEHVRVDGDHRLSRAPRATAASISLRDRRGPL